MSTKKQTVKKLPKGLPPLPPVPAGYDAWEYVEALSGIQNAPWTRLQSDGTWFEFIGFNGADIKPMLHEPNCHCIRAIKRPAPKQPRAKAVKAGYKLTVTVTGAVASRSAAMTKVLCAFASRKPDGCVFKVKPFGLIPARKSN